MTKRERLTERIGDGIRYYDGTYLQTCYPKNNNLRPLDKLAVKLCELEDKIANGTLVELPCKVGQKIWFVVEYDGKHFLDEGEVGSVYKDNGGIWLSARYDSGLHYHHQAKDVGKKVFLTKEEAEKALAERSREK